MNKHLLALLSLCPGARRGCEQRHARRRPTRHADEASARPERRAVARRRRVHARARDLRGRRAARVPRVGDVGRRAPLAPGDVALDGRARRLGGAVDRIDFAPQGDFLRGTAIVREPHSFDVDRRRAPLRGREHRFEYESYEGRTTIAADVARDCRHRHCRRRPRHDRRRARCSTAPSRPTPRACAPCTRASPGVIRSVEPQRRRRRALRRHARDDRVEREPADLHRHGADRAASSPRATRRPASRRTPTRCSRSRISRPCGRSSTCSRATARGCAPGSRVAINGGHRRAARGRRSTTSRPSATARRRASRRASCSTTPTAAGHRASSSRAA